jgi:hypothetical protein
LTHAEVIELQRPTAEHLRTVRAHLAQFNCSIRESLAGDKLVVTLVDNTESTLLLEQLPPAVLAAVDMVSGSRRASQSIDGPARKTRALTSSAAAPSASANPYKCLADKVNPTCLHAAYGLNQAKASAGTKASQAVIVNQAYNKGDIKDFLSTYKLPALLTPIKNVLASPDPPRTAGDEASLDLEYITSTGLGVPTVGHTQCLHTVLIHYTHTLYSHTTLIHHTHILYHTHIPHSYTILTYRTHAPYSHTTLTHHTHTPYSHTILRPGSISTAMLPTLSPPGSRGPPIKRMCHWCTRYRWGSRRASFQPGVSLG